MERVNIYNLDLATGNEGKPSLVDRTITGNGERLLNVFLIVVFIIMLLFFGCRGRKERRGLGRFSMEVYTRPIRVCGFNIDIVGKIKLG